MYKKFTLIAALLMVLAGTFFPAAAAAADGVTKITYWHYLSGDNAEIHQKMVEEFNAAHPHIQVEMLYTGNQFVARDKLLAAVAGDAPPAVALVDQFWPPLMVSTGPWCRSATSWIPTNTCRTTARSPKTQSQFLAKPGRFLSPKQPDSAVQ